MNKRQQCAWAVMMVAVIVCIAAGIMGLSQSISQHDGDYFVFWCFLLALFGFTLGSEIYDCIQKVRR